MEAVQTRTESVATKAPSRGQALPGPAQPGSERYFAYLLLGITAVAALLRFTTLNVHSLWLDEACTASLYRAGYLDMFLGRIWDHGSPPLAFLVGKAWAELFGYSEAGLRSLPALLSTLTVPLIALLGRRLLGAASGLWAALLFALSPQALELSHEVRTYGLVGLLTVLSTLCFVYWLEKRSWWSVLAYAATTTLACYTHYYGFTVVAAQGLSLVLWPAYRRHVLAWLGVMVLCLVLYSHWLPSFYGQVTFPGNLGRLLERWHFQFLATPLTFFMGRTLVWRDEPLWLLGGSAGVVTCLFWGMAWWGYRCARGRGYERILLASWTLTPILVPLVVALLFTPIYHSRYATVGLPGLLLLVGHGLANLGGSRRIAAVAAMITLMAISTYRYLSEPVRDDWRSVVPLVLQHVGSNNVVVFSPDYQAQPFRYYAEKAGNVPTTMLGLTTQRAGDNSFLAVRRERGELVEQQPQDYARLVAGAAHIWLLECTPETPPEESARRLRALGFVQVHMLQHGRIVCTQYVREADSGRKQ